MYRVEDFDQKLRKLVVTEEQFVTEMSELVVRMRNQARVEPNENSKKAFYDKANALQSKINKITGQPNDYGHESAGV